MWLVAALYRAIIVLQEAAGYEVPVVGDETVVAVGETGVGEQVVGTEVEQQVYGTTTGIGE